MKYLLPSITFVFILLLCSCGGSKNNKAGADNDLEQLAQSKDASIEVVKKELQNILSKTVGKTAYENDRENVNKYFTDGFKTYFNRACEKAEKEGYERPRLWWQYSDCDPEKYDIKSIEFVDKGRVKALITLSSEFYNGKYEIILLEKQGSWLIDSITEKENEYNTPNEESYSSTHNYDWLQGHWVYEQGNYKGHFIIQGDKLIQYSSMNKDRYEGTFRVEDGEIRARLIDGMDLVAKIDFANQRIDYGDGQWMHKVASEDNSQEVASSEERLFRNEDDVYMNFVSQTFVDNSGLKIRFGGNGEMEIDGDYAGIARVKSYNSQRAILGYSGGAYGEGVIILSIEGGTAKLIDPNDPSSVWYRKRTL